MPGYIASVLVAAVTVKLSCSIVSVIAEIQNAVAVTIIKVLSLSVIHHVLHLLLLSYKWST